MSLHLGAEVFDVHIQPTGGDHNHLFIRQGAGLQGQDVFRSKLTFRPHSTDTLTHRKMTLSMADRSSKAHTVKVLAAVGADPETQKASLVRREEERMRAAARREAQTRRAREREVSSRGPLSGSFLDGERRVSSSSEDDQTSIDAIKKSYKPGGAAFQGGRGGSSDGSGAEGRRQRTLRSDDSGSDSDQAPAPKKSKLIEDSDDDEGEGDKAKAASGSGSGSGASSPEPEPARPPSSSSSDQD